jgi:ribonucleoside-diphosphate reductase alpha chain
MVNIYEELSAKRKEQQALGKYPEWFTTGGYQMFKEKYEYEADGYNEQIRRIAKHLAKFSPKFLDKSHPFYETIVKNYGDNWEDCFYTLYYKGDAVPSSPLLANCGTDRGSTVSCSGGVTHNSVRGFYDSYKENALLTKEAFGTSTYLGGVQGRGTLTSKGFKATGTKPVLDAHFQMARDVSQGQVRRGSIACYLEIDHIDFDEWADALHKNPQGQNIGWIITKKFIALLNENDEEAHRRFSKALWVKMLTGKGYFWKVDHVNEQQPQMYKDLGLSNKASNLCSEIVLHADEDHTYTCILMSMNCYNFDYWEKSGGVFVATVLLDCLVSDFLDRAKNILGLEKAVRFTEKSRALGLGLYGWHSYLQSKMIGLEEYQAHAENMRVFSHMQEESLQASQWLASELGEPEWCKGYGVRHTHRCVTGDTKVLTDAGQIEIKDLVGKNVKVWNGEEFSEVKPFETGVSEIYRVKFSNGLYLDCTKDHKFIIATPKRDTNELGGLKTIEVETSDLRVGDCLPKFRVESSGTELELKDAYTSGLFCGDGSINNSSQGEYPRKELRLYGSKTQLAKYVTWKSKNTWGGDDCVRGYLPDSVLDKYVVPHDYSILSKQKWLAGLVDSDGSSNSKGIIITMKDYDFAKEVSLLVQSLGGEPFVHRRKRTGGYNSDNEIYYGVSISLFSINEVFSLFQPKRVIVDISKNKCKIGKRHLIEVESVESLNKSEMTYCFTERNKGLGVFNGMLTKQCAIAPNMSSAVIGGQYSQGIEPWLANVFSQPTAAGEMQRINPELIKLVESKGRTFTKALIKSIVDNKGSIQHLDWLTDQEKLVFKTAFEIDQKVLLRLASTRQQFIDQGQSLNLFFSSEEDEAYIAEVHKEFLLDDRLKGLYYIRSESGVMSAKDECIACES